MSLFRSVFRNKIRHLSFMTRNNKVKSFVKRISQVLLLSAYNSHRVND